MAKKLQMIGPRIRCIALEKGNSITFTESQNNPMDRIYPTGVVIAVPTIALSLSVPFPLHDRCCTGGQSEAVIASKHLGLLIPKPEKKAMSMCRMPGQQ